MTAVSVGRVVHYFSYNMPATCTPEPRAAIVTAVTPDGERVHLTVLEKNGFAFKHHVQYSEEPAAGTWSWPPRV